MGVPPRLLQGQKFSVVLISPFHSQSEHSNVCWGNFDPLQECACKDLRLASPFPPFLPPFSTCSFSTSSQQILFSARFFLFLSPTFHQHDCVGTDERDRGSRGGGRTRTTRSTVLLEKNNAYHGIDIARVHSTRSSSGCCSTHTHIQQLQRHAHISMQSSHR